MPGLLDPLTPDQQWLVDLVAEAYIVDEGHWPIFDYLEARFDAEYKDAWETLYSLPRFGRWQYGAAWWVGLQQPQKPAAETQIELTALGMHHSVPLKDRPPIFLTTLRYMIELQRRARPSTREVRRLEVNADVIQTMLAQERRAPLWEETLSRLPDLWKREPATWAGGESRNAEGVWTKGVPRTVLDYEGVVTIEEYIDRLEALTATPSVPDAETAPSPLTLVAALDSLDMAWRVAHGGPLFSYPSAERAAKLTYPANTPEELDSRLAALGEILRTANVTVRRSGRKLEKQTRDEPLAPLRAFLDQQADLDVSRIGDAVTTLEAAVSVRDAAQHTEAGGRAVIALTQEFGLAHPVVDPTYGWAVLTSRVVSALTVIRDEIASNF